MKYISSVLLIIGIIGFAYGSQEQSNINKIFDKIGILLEESGPLTVDYFEEIAGLINQANVINQSLKISKHLDIADHKERLYDMYNARQAVDDNNELKEGVISIIYDDPTPIFGGRKEKQITDPLRNIDPSIEAIEEQRFREQKILEDPTPIEGLEEKRLKMFKKVGKGALATIAIVGVVAAVMNQEQVMATIQETSISLERISEILRNITSRVVNFIQVGMTRLSRQVKRLWAAPLTQPIATATMSQMKLENIAESAGKIEETAKAAITGMENLRNVADAIKTAVLSDVKKVAVSVFKDLEGKDGTVLNLLNREYIMASNEGNRDLAFKIVDTKSGIFDSSLIVIKRMIESGKIKVKTSDIVRKTIPKGRVISGEGTGESIVSMENIPKYLNFLNEQFQKKFRDLKHDDYESAYRLWKEFLTKVPFSIKEQIGTFRRL